MLAVLAVAALGPCLFYAGYVGINAVNCPAFYNPDVADFCGWDAPDEDVVAMPAGWAVLTTDDGVCGSGGCTHRVWVLEAPDAQADLVTVYATAAQENGWLGEELPDATYLKRGEVCLQPFGASARSTWKDWSVQELNDAETADRRILVLGNLVNGGARWDGPRPPTTGPLDEQCALGL